MIPAEMIGPMLGMLVADPGQRADIERQIAAFFQTRGVYCLALGDDSGTITHRFQTPDEIATGIMGILAGELGIFVPGYENVLTPAEQT